MLNTNSGQQAGDQSLLVKIDKVNINSDLIYKQCKDLIDEENKNAILNSRLVAENVASERLEQYENILLPKLVKAELLSCFSDPTMQFLFRTSQKAAVCSDRRCDYEMLSEMLIHRVENKENFTISAAIEKAINEVNNISEEALMVLTVIYSIITYIPNSFDVKEGLSALDELYGKILENFALPTNFDWLNNLEVVNAIRIGNIGGSIRCEDYFIKKLNCYTVKGIKKGSNNYNKALKQLKENNLPTDILIENQLNSNYVMIPIKDKNSIDNICLRIEKKGIVEKVELTIGQKEVLKQIMDLYELGSFNLLLKRELSNYRNIKKIIDWWNSNLLKISFSLTTVGKVLACTNARRIDSTLPVLKIM